MQAPLRRELGPLQAKMPGTWAGHCASPRRPLVWARIRGPLLPPIPDFGMSTPPQPEVKTPADAVPREPGALAHRFCPECGQPRTEDVCPIHDIPTIVQQTDDFTKQLIGTLVAGRYKVESLIGQGGFGAVFRAINQTMRQEMVIKVLRPEYAKDPIQVQRFFNEGRTAAQLKEQHTVKVFDFGQTDAGQLYLAMELLHGQELAKVLRDQRYIDPIRTMRMAIAVLKSLAEAHDLGMVHRDLKPENVFLCRMRGEEDFVKLIDFGIAKSFEQQDQDLTKTGFAVGTPKYMSPEQGRAETLDGRSDLYSLGIILYQCLTGDVPFRAPSAMGIIVKHLQEKPAPVQEACVQDLPPGLADVVMKALQKRREDRFENADDMRHALENILETAGEPLVQTGARGRGHTSRSLPHVAAPQESGQRATPGALQAAQTPGSLLADPGSTPGRTPERTPTNTPGEVPGLRGDRPRYSSGIGEMLDRNFGGTPSGGTHSATTANAWIPPMDSGGHEPLTEGSLVASANQNRTPGQNSITGQNRDQANRRPVSSSVQAAHSAGRRVPAPPSKTAGAWVFALVILVILAGSAYWYWMHAQQDPEAMEKFRSVTEFVDKSKAKLDELTGATDQPVEKAETPAPKTTRQAAQANADDDANARHKNKPAKNKEITPVPVATMESAVAATQDAVRKCYVDGPRTVHGKARDFTHVAVDVTVDAQGQVKRASLRKKFGTGRLAGCVESAVMQAHMPLDAPGDRTLEYDLPAPEEK